jgi:uncharacterized protein (DUF2267 family)
MDYQTYLSVVQDSLGADQETAERVTRAVASVLGERIGADEARVYAAHLPPEVAAWLHTAGGARSFDSEEFVRRVAEREETNPDTAERHITAVLGAMSQGLPEREYDHLLARLSKDYAPLLPRRRYRLPCRRALSSAGSRNVPASTTRRRCGWRKRSWRRLPSGSPPVRCATSPPAFRCGCMDRSSGGRPGGLGQPQDAARGVPAPGGPACRRRP